MGAFTSSDAALVNPDFTNSSTSGRVGGCRHVHPMHHRVADGGDRAFFGIQDIEPGVLRLAGSSCDRWPNGDDRRLGGKRVEEGIRAQIRDPIGIQRAHKGDRSWCDPTEQQLMAISVRQVGR